MKHLIRLIFLPLCISILGISIALADESPIKVGVLDWQALLSKAPQAVEAGNRLEKEFQGRKDKLISKQKEFQTKQEKLQRDKDVLSEAERVKTEKELAKMQQELRRLDEEYRSDFTERHRSEMDDFLKIVREVVDKLATDEKYDLVLPQDSTIFIAERMDLTEKVLDRLTKVKSSKKVETKESKEKESKK